MTYRVTQRVILSVLLLGLFACTKPPTDPIRIASSPWPGYEPLYLARDLGYFENTHVRLFELPSSDITMESFRNHSTDVATLTLDETLELLHDNTRLRILMVLDISNGGDAVMVRPDIKNLSDIKGKRISIVNIPLGLYMLSRLLDKAGVRREDVTVFPMSESKQENFYKTGKADVVITFEPVKTKLLDAGAHVIFDSSMIPNEIFDLLLVHESVYLERREELCNIAGAWFRTLKYMEGNRDDAAAKITQRLGVNISEYDNILNGIILATPQINKTMLGSPHPGLLEPAQRLAKIMLDEHQISSLVDARGAIDSSFSSCYR